jgi:mannose-6-phosphate isomerase-like protein (cupin superfamily)
MEPMNTNSARPAIPSMVAGGQDRFGQLRDLGISRITFKVGHGDSTELFIAENLMHAKGGPARHIHHTQDEWFFVRQGEFTIEVGQERHLLKPGDSIWGPRGIPHVWEYTSEGPGSILFVYNPAGKIEAFFEALAKLNSVAPSNAQFWRAYDMEYVGPPLQV